MFIEGLLDAVWAYTLDLGTADFTDSFFLAEGSGWITQVIELASALELEEFIRMAELRGFIVVVLAVAVFVGGIKVTLAVKPKSEGPQTAGA